MADLKSTSEELLVSVSDRVATLTINRPERRNALSWGLVEALVNAVRDAKNDAEVGALIIEGAGRRAFCAGADLAGMAAGASDYDLHLARGRLADLFHALWELGKPTIAKVRGYCLAGGFGLALSCDLVVCSDDAQFGTPEINVGLWPYMITVPMVRSMPPKRALELMMTGRRVDAVEGERIGFVNQVCAPEKLDEVAREISVAVAAHSPAVMRLGRDSFYRVLDLEAASALPYLHSMLSVGARLEDAAEGIAAFTEKREPQWGGQ